MKPEFSIEHLNESTIDYFDLFWRFGAKFHKDVGIEVHKITNGILAAVLERVTARTKLQWEGPLGYSEPSLYAQVEVRVKGDRGTLCLVLKNGAAHLSLEFKNQRELPSMDSSFWAELASLVEDHELAYEDSSRPFGDLKNEHDKKMAKFRKAPIFALLFDFMVTGRHENNGFSEGHFGDFNAGRLFEGDWTPLIEEFAEIARKFHRLSQALHRSAYLKEQSYLRGRKRKLAESKQWSFTRFKRYTHKDCNRYRYFGHSSQNLDESSCLRLFDEAELQWTDLSGEELVDSFEEGVAVHRVNGFDQQVLVKHRFASRDSIPPWYQAPLFLGSCSEGIS